MNDTTLVLDKWIPIEGTDICEKMFRVFEEDNIDEGNGWVSQTPRVRFKFRDGRVTGWVKEQTFEYDVEDEIKFEVPGYE